MKPAPIMRVLLLAALAASGLADTNVCGTECVGAIFTEVVKAKTAGFEDEDAATYGYLLYKGFERAGVEGATFVYNAIQFIGGEDACDVDGDATRTKIVKCFNDASADSINDIDTLITDGCGGECGTDELKEAVRYIFGVLANQLASGSEPASKWTDSLTDDELTTAIKVFNMVGTWQYKVAPVLAAAFDDAGAACTLQVYDAIGYEDGEDLAAALANDGEKAFGADGLGSDACFGEGSNAKETFTATIDGKEKTFDADNKPLAALEEAKTEADTAISAQLKAAGVDATDASPAAVLSAAAALIAMML